MKKKIILSFSMILICAGMIFLVKGFQEKAAAVPQAGTETSQKAEAAAQTAEAAQASGTTKTADKAASVTGSSNADASSNSGTAGKSTTAGKNSGTNTNATSVSSGSKSPAAAKPVQKASNNFVVYDSASGAYLTSLSVEFSSGDSVADVTMKALNGDYRAAGSGDSIYFSKIMGISEKSAGALSGWCFYVNGQKPGLSAGSYKLKSGDVVEWKFLKDGTNN